MKKYYQLGVFSILLLSVSLVQAEDVVHDGYWWVSMGHIAKGYFLEGFEVGVNRTSNNSVYSSLKKENYIKTIDGLDLFYKDSQNKSVRIHVAIYIVLRKIQGRSIETIKKLIELARQSPTRIPKIR
jgi:hypothetical protein